MGDVVVPVFLPIEAMLTPPTEEDGLFRPYQIPCHIGLGTAPMLPTHVLHAFQHVPHGPPFLGDQDVHAYPFLVQVSSLRTPSQCSGVIPTWER
jgi:hypothetical protein